MNPKKTNNLNAFKTKIRNLDRFGKTFQFKFPDRRDTFKSWHGLVVTIIVYMLLGSYGFLKGRKLLFSETRERMIVLKIVLLTIPKYGPQAMVLSLPLPSQILTTKGSLQKILATVNFQHSIKRGDQKIYIAMVLHRYR